MTEKLPPACRVTITTRSGSTFTGILQSTDEVCGKIVLNSACEDSIHPSQVHADTQNQDYRGHFARSKSRKLQQMLYGELTEKLTTAGAKLYGPQIFYRSDLTDLQFTDVPQGPGSQAEFISGKDGHIGHQMFAPRKSSPQKQRSHNIDTDELAMANILGEDNGDQGIGSGDDGLVTESEDYHEQDGCTLISRVCDKFYDAIVYIMQQRVVGMAFEGVNLGRSGTLSLIQVATETDVIIFDMLRLGDKAFNDGLQALLEDANIVKIIHDCRWISDMMREKYNILVANVFDTQVANAFVYKITHNGNWPRYVESLRSCLMNHLNLPADEVSFVKIRERFSEKDQSVWLQRPLSERLLVVARRNVCYLISLYHVLFDKLLLEFKTGVELYLSHVSKLNGEIESCRMHSHILPYIFLEIPKLVNCAFADGKDTLAVKGFQDSYLNITDKRIISSHDSVWHSPKGFWTPRQNSKPDQKAASTHGSKCEKCSADSSCNNESVICSASSSSSENRKVNDGGIGKLKKEGRQNGVSYSEKEVICVNHQAAEACLADTAGVTSLESCNDMLQQNRVQSCNMLQQNRVQSCNDMQQNHEGCAESELHLSTPQPVLDIDKNIFLLNLRKNLSTKHNEGSPSPSCQTPAAPICHMPQLGNVSGSSPERDLKQSKALLQKASQKLVNLNSSHDAKSAVTGSSSASSHSDKSSHPHPPLSFPLSSSESSPTSPGSDTKTSECDKALGSFSFVPAGFREMPISKKKSGKQKKHELNSHQRTCLSDSPTDDFSYIPTQNSLKCQCPLILGTTSFAMADPFSEDESVLLDQKNCKSIIKSQLAYNGEKFIEDSDIEIFQHSDAFQQVLKQASSSSSGNLRNRLLPPKL